MIRADQYAARTGSWVQDRNRLWVRTLSHHVAHMCITESTSAAAKWCITRASRAASADVPWKKFLSIVSPVAEASWSGPVPRPCSISAK